MERATGQVRPHDCHRPAAIRIDGAAIGVAARGDFNSVTFTEGACPAGLTSNGNRSRSFDSVDDVVPCDGVDSDRYHVSHPEIRNGEVYRRRSVGGAGRGRHDSRDHIITGRQVCRRDRHRDITGGDIVAGQHMLVGVAALHGDNDPYAYVGALAQLHDNLNAIGQFGLIDAVRGFRNGYFGSAQ